MFDCFFSSAQPSPDPAEHHAAYFPLDAFSGLHDALVGGDKNTFTDTPHAPDELGIPPPHNLSELVRVQPDALGRLGQHLHLLEYGLAVPVLHAQPQTPARSVLLGDSFHLVQDAGS